MCLGTVNDLAMEFLFVCEFKIFASSTNPIDRIFITLSKKNDNTDSYRNHPK